MVYALRARRAFRSALLAASAALLLAGCPLIADYPLSDPKAAHIDADLCGSWETRDAESGKASYLRFMPFDEHELVGITTNGDGAEASALRAFTTVIEGTKFINVRELGKDISGWSILRYGIEDGALRLTSIDDGLLRGKDYVSSSGLYEMIKLNLDDPRLFAPSEGEAPFEMVWSRVPEEAPKNG
jgi:hypothetical protein